MALTQDGVYRQGRQGNEQLLGDTGHGGRYASRVAADPRGVVRDAAPVLSDPGSTKDRPYSRNAGGETVEVVSDATWGANGKNGTSG